jgi:L-threonylcarbamoyladenylate synthase
MRLIPEFAEDLAKRAAQVLSDGNLVVFPTETVYGLGADALNRNAVAKVYAVKGRPIDHPLIIHISSMKGMADWASEIPQYAFKLAKAFWPGPMTLILPKTRLAKSFVTGAQSTVGLRVPAHPLALELLRQFERLGGKGIAAPSANRFGAVSPTTVEAVNDELGTYLAINDLILDGGKSKIGIESTIIDCRRASPGILRPGAVTVQMVEECTNAVIDLNLKSNILRSPGLLEKHYSPRAKVLLGAKAEPGDGFIAMAGVRTPIGAIRLTAPTNIEEYARDLYSGFRIADQKGIPRIIVKCPEGPGLALAIRDRLNKAAFSK